VFNFYQEAQLLTPEMHIKIREFQERLDPQNLPKEVAASGNFVCGSQINRQKVMQRYLQHFGGQQFYQQQ
jgi:hypothetical protein